MDLKKYIGYISCLIVVLIFFAVAAVVIGFNRGEKGNYQQGATGQLCSEVPKVYADIFKVAEKKYKVNAAFLAGIFSVEHDQPEEYRAGYTTATPKDTAWPEKNGDPKAVTKWKTSSAGALGPMQFMPCTWDGWTSPRCSGGSGQGTVETDPQIVKQYGGIGQDGNGDGKADPQNIEDAVFAAAHYFDTLGAGNNTTDENKLREAAAHYNGGTNPGKYAYEVYAKNVLEAFHKFSCPAFAGNCGQSIIAQAQKYVGIPYKQIGGHCGPNTIGPSGVTFVDCSGFVSRVYRDLGLLSPNACYDTLDLTTRPSDFQEISASQIQTGDVVISGIVNGVKSSQAHAVIYVSGDVTKKFTIWESGGGGDDRVGEALRPAQPNQRYFHTKSAKCTVQSNTVVNTTAPPIIQKLLDFTTKHNGKTRLDEMADYSLKHYGDKTSVLNPTAVVWHYTVGNPSPQGLYNQFNAHALYTGEYPTPYSHFFIDTDGKIYQFAPENVRARHAPGINNQAIGIEFSGSSENEVVNRGLQYEAGLKLTKYLMKKYSIPKQNILGHTEVDSSALYKDITGYKTGHTDWKKNFMNAVRNQL